MTLKRLDHVNVRTNKLPAMIEWYGRVLGLEPGPRPAFPFGGAWLYCDGFPIVHLVEVAKEPAVTETKLEHFAIAGENLIGFLVKLRQEKVAYRLGEAPGFDIRQVNIWDPDGNHIHIDFQGEEQPEQGDYDGS